MVAKQQIDLAYSVQESLEGLMGQEEVEWKEHTNDGSGVRRQYVIHLHGLKC